MNPRSPLNPPILGGALRSEPPLACFPEGKLGGRGAKFNSCKKFNVCIELLWNKLPDWMDDKQRKNKVTNLIAEYRGSNKIFNDDSDVQQWVLVK
jgi:hypothetical protein